MLFSSIYINSCNYIIVYYKLVKSTNMNSKPNDEQK